MKKEGQIIKNQNRRLTYHFILIEVFS